MCRNSDAIVPIIVKSDLFLHITYKCLNGLYRLSILPISSMRKILFTLTKTPNTSKKKMEETSGEKFQRDSFSDGQLFQ